MPPPPRALSRPSSFLPFLITWSVVSTHVFLSPYTKVEESFTLHAVHDVLKYGLSPDGVKRVSVERLGPFF